MITAVRLFTAVENDPPNCCQFKATNLYPTNGTSDEVFACVVDRQPNPRGPSDRISEVDCLRRFLLASRPASRRTKRERLTPLSWSQKEPITQPRSSTGSSLALAAACAYVEDVRNSEMAFQPGDLPATMS